MSFIRMFTVCFGLSMSASLPASQVVESNYFNANNGTTIRCDGGYTIKLLDNYYELAEILKGSKIYKAYYTGGMGSLFTAYVEGGNDIFSFDFPDNNVKKAVFKKLPNGVERPIKCTVLIDVK